MKRSQFTDQQIAFILRQADEGAAVEEVCRKAGISIQTYYRWRKKYGGLMPSELSWPMPQDGVTRPEATQPVFSYTGRSNTGGKSRALPCPTKPVQTPGGRPPPVRAPQPALGER
jgi:hypothetical protein